MQLATLIRFIHFRRDGARWIADLELEIGHTWMGWYEAKTKRAVLENIKAVTGRDVQFGSDPHTGWV